MNIRDIRTEQFEKINELEKQCKKTEVELEFIKNKTSSKTYI